MDQLGNRVVVRGGRGKLFAQPTPHPILQSTAGRPKILPHASGQIFKDDTNGFSSTSDICVMDKPPSFPPKKRFVASCIC
jgi:hypothetical protein